MSRFDSNFLDSIKNSQIYEEDHKDNYYMSNIATKGAMIIVFLSFVLVCAFIPFSLPNILALICTWWLVFDYYFVEKIFGPVVKTVTDVICVIAVMLSSLTVWLIGGGYYGMSPYMMLFAMAYCMFCLKKSKLKSAIAAAFGLTAISLFVITYFYPDIVFEIDNNRRPVLIIFAFFALTFYLQILFNEQINLFNKDRKKLFEVQEELTAHFEQSLAMNDELSDTTEKLEMLNKTQRSFNASMNHELRAPLNGIEGCLQILMLDESLSQEAKETVKNALTASKTINQTVNDILDYAKLEEGKFEIVEKPFDLREVLDNLTTIFRPQANAKNLKFFIKIPTDTRVSLVSDGVRIQQVMTNLISNAIKYTKEGTVIMTVTTQRGHLNFTVSDTGQGMSEESLKVLFDPFTRFNLEKNTNIQGTGLGMNIVSNMVREMNGHIDVESKLDVGTTFYVDIPIMFYDSAITYNTPRDKDNNENKLIDLSSYRVLCVDDTEVNRSVFKGLLKNTKAKITTVECGSRAIKLCEQIPFDIIFLDHMMPEMDGIETLHGIRNIKDEKYKNTPIVMFTGNAGEEYQKLYKDNGADGYLLKPIMYEDLINTFSLIKKD